MPPPDTESTSTAPSGRTRQATSARSGFDVQRFRDDFPALLQRVHGHPLVYLDNAATTHKPRGVIDAVRDFYEHDNANVHRGLHHLSERATATYESARRAVARFLGARDPSEIVFTRGTTEAINLVAHAWAARLLQPGDEVLVSHMEHHGNIVPWQTVCNLSDATLRVVPVDDQGRLDLEAFASLLSERTRLVAIVHVSNVLGTVNPVAEITAKAHDAGAVVLIDGAQAVAHLPVSVADIGCDFYAFSGHKCFAPMGIGVLYGRRELLDRMPPYQTGGEMIESVSFAKTTFADPPLRFEAGTPNVVGAIGLAAAIDHVQALDRPAVMEYESGLLAYASAALQELRGLRLIGIAERKSAIMSFVIDHQHPYDLAPILDRQGVAVRTGHHCAQPLMERFGVPATVRASLAPYNTRDEIDTLVAALDKARSLLC